MSYLSTTIQKLRYLISRDDGEFLILQRENGSLVNVALDTPASRDAAISAAVNNLLAGVPGALDTLNELATALGDDPNFAATVTTALGNRLTWKGAWAATFNYVRNDLVLFNGGLYVSPVNFVSGASFVKANWIELVPQSGTYALKSRAADRDLDSLGQYGPYTIAVADNFERSDRVLAGDKAPTGQVWSQNGNTILHIVGGKLSLAGTDAGETPVTIGYEDAGVTPSSISVIYEMVAGTTNNHSMVFGFAPVSFALGSIQIRMSLTDWHLFVVTAPQIINPYPVLASGTFDTPLSLGVLYQASFYYDVKTSTLTIILPEVSSNASNGVGGDSNAPTGFAKSGRRIVLSHPDFNTYSGRHVGVQAWRDATDGYPMVDSVSIRKALSPRPSYANNQAMDSLLGLRRRLDAGLRSAAILVMGDDWVDGADEWPYLLGQLIGADHPAYTVRWYPWSDATQLYGVPTIIQTGTAGALYLDGGTGTQKSRVLDSTVTTHLSGVIRVEMKLRLASYNVIQDLVGRYGAAGSRSWKFAMANVGTGRPQFIFSPDGTTTIPHTASANVPIADGIDVWVAGEWNPNNGGNTTTDFYTSIDGVTWTALGVQQSTAGVTTLFNPVATGFFLGGNSTMLAGERVYEVRIRNGHNGPNVVPQFPDLWTIQTGSALCVGAPILSILAAATSGGGCNIAYLTDPTRLPIMTPDMGVMVTFLAQSHNMGTQMGKLWANSYDAFIATVQAAVKAPIITLTQNPEGTGTTNSEWHTARCRELPAISARNKVANIDTFQMYAEIPAYGTTMLNNAVTGIYTDPIGSAAAASLIKAALDAAA